MDVKLGYNYDPQLLQQIYNADIQNAKARIFESQNKQINSMYE